jgi:hypothetical protein
MSGKGWFVMQVRRLAGRDARLKIAPVAPLIIRTVALAVRTSKG